MIQNENAVDARRAVTMFSGKISAPAPKAPSQQARVAFRRGLRNARRVKRAPPPSISVTERDA